MFKQLIKIILLLFFINQSSAQAYTQKAQDYFLKGNQSYQNHNYEKAILDYNQAIKACPEFIEAHFNLALTYDKIKNFESALQEYNSVLSLDPSNKNVKNNISTAHYNYAVDLFNSSEFKSAIYNLRQSISIEKKSSDSYYLLGNCYYKINDFNQAISNYEKALQLDPTHNDAINNLKVAKERSVRLNTSHEIDNIKASNRAPFLLYQQIKMGVGVPESFRGRVYDVLDILWSDYEAQKLFKVIVNNQIPIIITYGSGMTNAQTSTREQNHYLTIYGIPVLKMHSKKEKNYKINIGADHIFSFRDSSLPIERRIYGLHVLIHEMCHATKSVISKERENALSEELSASMIGYNIASRIIKGRDLTADESYEYSKRMLQALLIDDHRNLQIYNSFNDEIIKMGVQPPHLHRYNNLLEIYKAIRNNLKTNKLDAFEKQL